MTEKDICMLPESFCFKSIYSEDVLYHAEEVKFGYRVTWGCDGEAYYSESCEKPTPLGVGWIAQKI